MLAWLLSACWSSLPDTLPALSVAEITALPERQIEASLINRLLRTSPDAALPANLDARVRIYAPASIPRNDVEGVAAFLRRQGLDVGAPTPVSYPIPANQIRYYHRGDYAAAQSLGVLMGATVIRAERVGDDTPFRGVVDIWIAGE